MWNRLQTSEKQDRTATLQKKKTKRKKPAQDQKKWLFKGRISTELMEIESVDDGTCKRYTLATLDVLIGCYLLSTRDSNRILFSHLPALEQRGH